MAQILIAEPDSDGRALLAWALEAAGHRVVSVADAFAALAVSGELRPDIILLSAALPKGRPQEVLRLLETITQPRRVIGLGRLDGDRAALPTADAWLMWPIDPVALAEALHEPG